jgi:hypothetical protein
MRGLFARGDLARAAKRQKMHGHVRGSRADDWHLKQETNSYETLESLRRIADLLREPWLSPWQRWALEGLDQWIRENLAEHRKLWGRWLQRVRKWERMAVMRRKGILVVEVGTYPAPSEPFNMRWEGGWEAERPDWMTNPALLPKRPPAR